MFDNITWPAHYAFGAIQPIEAIEAWGLGFHLGNCVKYIARAGRKNNLLEDLRKAQWYLERYIQTLEPEDRLKKLLEGVELTEEEREEAFPEEELAIVDQDIRDYACPICGDLMERTLLENVDGERTEWLCLNCGKSLSFNSSLSHVHDWQPISFETRDDDIWETWHCPVCQEQEIRVSPARMDTQVSLPQTSQ